MVKLKKITSLLVIAIMLLPMFAFVRVDYGLRLNNGKKDNKVYVSVTSKKSEMEKHGATIESLTSMLEETHGRISDYTNWDYKEINYFTASNENILGGEYAVTSDSIAVKQHLWTGMNYYTNAKYAERRTLFTRTVMVSLAPNYIAKDIYYDRFADEIIDIKDYYFVIETPTDIISTDGTVRADGRSVEWDVEDMFRVNKQSMVMTVTFKDYRNVKFIVIGVIVLIGIIVVILLNNKKTIVVDDENVRMIPEPMKPEDRPYEPPTFTAGQGYGAQQSSTYNTAKTYDANRKIKCPECGNMVDADDNFCEKCGRFF